MKKFIFFILSLASFYLHSQNAITYVPYQGKMKEIKTKHFVVIFPDKYSAIGLKVADYAEEVHERLKDFIKWTPRTKTNVILSDETDYPNGLANVMLRNTIVLYLSPSDLEETLKSFNDPLYSLIVHEYTHILHLDQIRGGAFFWRVIFGKLYHPVINTFKWYIEGVAVLSETRNSKGGRLESAYNRALIREAAKNKKIPDYDKLVFPVVDFPHGDAVYHFGAKFIEYLYDTYGKEKFHEIYLKISDDFWPFVLMFNMNFKNIYGKSLKDLWAEWIKNEENLAKNDYYETIPPNNSQLTFFEGEINDFDIKEDALLVSSVSLKNDKYLYLLRDKKIKKIRNQSCRSVTFTNDEDYIVYTKASRYFDERLYFDLYSFNLKTKKEKKLSNKERINYVAFSKQEPLGLLVSHSPFGSRFFKASFKSGKILNKVELIVPDDIYFIDKPTIDKNGTKSIISCKTKSGKIKIFLVDLLKNKFIEIPNLKGRNPEFLNDNEFIFVSEENGLTRIVKRNLESGETKEILSSIGVFKAISSEVRVYYSKYTASGIEIFSCSTDKENEKSFETKDITGDSEGNIFSKSFSRDIKNYNPFRNWYPTLWGLLPVLIPDSNIFIETSKNNYFNIPFIAPQLFIFNQSTLGRFSYNLSITYDYLRNYPINSLSLLFRNPYISVSYYWYNAMGGNYSYTRGLEKSGFDYKNFKGRFPINFSNILSLNSSFDINSYSNISFSTFVYHYFNEYNYSDKKLTNKLFFSESISFSYMNSTLSSARWNRGIYFNISSFQSIGGLLDNASSYNLTTSFQARAPLKNAFFFINNSYGIDFLFNNSFTAGSSIFKISENIIGNAFSDGYSIDLRAFVKEISKISSGALFASLDMGFDISIYRRSRYSNFATLGFREFYIKTYSEFVYLYNLKFADDFYKGVMFDGVVELCLDLFIAYGNISFSLINGASIGYRVGDAYPAWNVFCYLSLGL